MKLALLLGVLAVAGFAAWVRLAPVDAARWHAWQLPETAPGAYPGAGRHLAVVTTDRAGVEALLAAIAATPRTRHVAGSAGEGLVTYETRSRLWGFPDYTTIRIADRPEGGVTLSIFGRLRFGSSDLGVNRARIEGWLARAGLGPAS